MPETHLFTSESVTEGHPDKMADQISDAVLDAILAEDPHGRVACETLVTTGTVVVAGEITSKTEPDIPTIVRGVIRDVGYTEPVLGFDAETCRILTFMNRQAPDIAMGVDSGGAGDQGMMFGYATDETPELMPLPITLAHKLARQLASVRREGILPFLRPDGKTQVTVEYRDHRPVRVAAVVVSTQHDPDVKAADLHEAIMEEVVCPILPPEMVDYSTLKCFINPTGRFVTGGPQADSGITGRKIIVDTYGGVGSHGGGCFSGKDPTKVDRSGSYAARHVAKNVVAAGLARRCEVQLAYAIGVADPISVMINSFGTGKLPNGQLRELVEEAFELTPGAIIEHLDLRRPIYRRTAVYGHFGREEDGFTWEVPDEAETLRNATANA